MKVEISHNQGKNGLEIKFPGKPDNSVLEWLKANKFRWSKPQGIWYNRYSTDLWKKVMYTFENKEFAVTESRQPSEKPSKETPKKSSFPFEQLYVYFAFKKALEESSTHSYRKDQKLETFIDPAKRIILKTSYTIQNGYSAGEINLAWAYITPKGKFDDIYDRDVETSTYTPVELPLELYVPKEKRKPHYDLSKYSSNYKERLVINRAVLLRELISGKMEVGTYKSFDGMQDMWEHSKEITYKDPDAYFWHDTFRDFAIPRSYDSPSHYNQYAIDFGKWRIRYKDGGISKPVKAVKTDLDQSAIDKIVQDLRNKAIALQPQIDSKFNSGVSKQNPTARRARIADGMRADGERLQNIQFKLNALANAWENDSIPVILKGIRTRAIIEQLISRQIKYPEQSKWNTEGWKNTGIKLKRSLDAAGITNEDALQLAKTELEAIGEFKISEEDQKRKEIKQLEDKWIGIKEPGFFPTPSDLAKMLVKLADIQPGEKVLEPSAGMGHIAHEIKLLHPDAEIEVVERFNSLREILKVKGFNVVGDDFLNLMGKGGKGWDKIIMNPPFENNHDIMHVRHAFTLLNPGGRVVAIMGEGAFFRQGKAETSFRAWIEDVNAVVEPLPENSFKSAFRTTGVSTRLVTIDKPSVYTAPVMKVVRDEPKEDSRKLILAKAEAESQAQRLRILALSLNFKDELKGIDHALAGHDIPKSQRAKIMAGVQKNLIRQLQKLK